MTAKRVLGESTIAIGAAARELPASRTGKPVAPSTVFRWFSRGIVGPGGQRVRLEAARLGGTWLTSREALARFLEAINPAPDEQAVVPRTPGQRRRASERAADELKAAGI